jgi:hypothetical protein
VIGEALNEDINNIKEENKYFMPYVTNSKMLTYSILRVGRRLKTTKQIKDFTNYTERIKENENADEELKEENRVIYGPEDPYKDVKQYIKDVKIYKNSVIGREMLLLAHRSSLKDYLMQTLKSGLIQIETG